MEFTQLYLLLLLVPVIYTSQDCPRQCTCPNSHKLTCSQIPTFSDFPPNYDFLTVRSVEILPNKDISYIGDLQIFPDLEEFIIRDSSIREMTYGIPGQLRKFSAPNNSFRDFDSLCRAFSIETIDLAHNKIADVHLHSCDLADTYFLNVSGNIIDTFKPRFQQFKGMEYLDLSYNFIGGRVDVRSLSRLRMLNISYNEITGLHLPDNSFFIRELQLSHNRIPSLSAIDFKGSLHHLEILDISSNRIEFVSKADFDRFPYLKQLYLNKLQLEHLEAFTFSAIGSSLTTLYISSNRLSTIDMNTFSGLHQLQILHLENNHLQTLPSDTFHDLTQLQQINLQGNAWHCDCKLSWLRKLKVNISGIVCATPGTLVNSSFNSLVLGDLPCPAHISNHTKLAMCKLGSSVMLDCAGSGQPTPVFTWITPRHKKLNVSEINPFNGSSLSDDHGGFYVLPNGSLYIDRVTKKDAGEYVCLVWNIYGNDSAVVDFRLDYLIIFETVIASVAVGCSSALGFIILGFVVAMIRLSVERCKEIRRKQHHQGIHRLLGSLEAYRSSKIDQLSAYKTAKIDQLSAYKTAKVDQLRQYKNLTLTSLVQYMRSTRVHYSCQITRVRDNCSQQAVRLREQYLSQKGKFKDYRSHHIDRLREQYNVQALRIRDYGAQQLEKLREQYKMQQQHILKLLELLNVDNCMNVVEAECMRTESMLFDADFNLDLDTHPVHPLRPSIDEEDFFLTPAESESGLPDNASAIGKMDEISLGSWQSANNEWADDESSSPDQSLKCVNVMVDVENHNHNNPPDMSLEQNHLPMHCDDPATVQVQIDSDNLENTQESAV